MAFTTLIKKKIRNMDLSPGNKSTQKGSSLLLHHSEKMASPESQRHVTLHMVFVEANGNVLEIVRKEVELQQQEQEQEQQVVPESVFVGLMHEHRHRRPDGRRFRWTDLLTYFVKYSSQETVDYARRSVEPKTTTTPLLLQVLPPIAADVVVPPSLFIFHKVNSLWLIFREEVLAVAAPTSVKPLAVSILKRSQTATTTNKNKKNVRISQDLPRYKELLRKPRKTIRIHDK